MTAAARWTTQVVTRNGAEHMRFFRELRADTITAICAVIVSAAALFVAADQARIAREQAEIMREEVNASIWPIIQIEYYSYIWDDRTETGFRVRNAGVGPALVKGLRLTHGEKTYQSIDELFALASPELRSMQPEVVRASLKDRVIGAGDTLEFMRAEWKYDTPPEDTATDDFHKLFADLRAIRVESCYCSALDRCWMTAVDETTTRSEVGSCDSFEPGNF